MPFRTEITRFERHEDEIRFIRHKVFVQEQGIASELEWDEQDQQAHFVLAFDESNTPVGTARFYDSGKIGRMAVLAKYRYKGCGECILNAVINWARQHNLSELHLSAQDSAITFYEKQGFVVTGAAYLAAGIPHQDMLKRL